VETGVANWVGLGVIVSLLTGGAASAQPTSASSNWPVAADIPRPGPVTLGLAGQGAPDIARYLLVQGASRLAVSPDGRTVAYISRVTGAPQLWAVEAAGGWPRQLTYGEGVDEFHWLPDGSGVLIGADAGGDERLGHTAVTLDGTRERIVLPRTAAFQPFGDFAPDGRRFAYASTARNGNDFDVYVAGLDGGTPRRVREFTGAALPIAWRPGTPEVLVREARGEDGADLSLLNVDTGALRPLLKPAESAEHADPVWLPDGSGFYLVSDQGRDRKGLAFYDMRQGRLRFVGAPDGEVEQVRLSGDGQWLAWLVNVGGFHSLQLMNLRTNARTPAPELPAGAYEIDFADHAPVLGVLVSGTQAVGEAYVWNVATGQMTRPVRTSWAGLDPKANVTPELLSFKARDGKTLTGLYYRPKGATGAPPLLLRLHGGPSSQASPAWLPEVQYLASRGIAVFDLNYRGSTGFGKAFARANDKRERPKEIGDLVDAVTWLRSTGRADPRRAAVTGRSYGGYLTNAVVGAHPELFVAAVSQVGVSDWVKALETASPELKASDRLEFGNIDDPGDRAFFAALSPINNAAKIKTPLLVQHGANDPRDPVAESDRFVQAVRAAGGEVAYVRFPDEGHGIAKTENQVHFFRRMAAFLEEKFGMAGAAGRR
jgi:dipeptidyl aminopeptidase/acylaminoacyl peptidase